VNFLSFFKASELRNVDPSSADYLRIQRDIILSRRLVKETYLSWYRLMTDAIGKHCNAPRRALLEFGSGGGFLKDVIPDVVTSDIIPVPGVDCVVDARTIPVRDGSLDAILMTHVLHHIPDVELFFREASRVLSPGGLITMVDVAATPFARFFFRNFHPEPFLPETVEWRFSQNDAMLDSNQALTWIIFRRDIGKFHRLYPEFEVCEIRLLPWFSYFISGGVTKPYLIPDVLAPLMRLVDKILTPLNGIFSLHWFIVVRKRVTGISSPTQVQGMTAKHE
jgi:SAM-dependent methyltransferase